MMIHFNNFEFEFGYQPLHHCQAKDRKYCLFACITANIRQFLAKGFIG